MILIDLPGRTKECFSMIMTSLSWAGSIKTEEIWELVSWTKEYFPLQTLMEGTTRVAGRVMGVASAVAAASSLSHTIANRQSSLFRAILEEQILRRWTCKATILRSIGKQLSVDLQKLRIHSATTTCMKYCRARSSVANINNFERWSMELQTLGINFPNDPFM